MENYSPLELMKARKKVKKIKEFYTHAIVYVCVNTFLIVINLLNSKNGIWFIFPLFGWGLGLFSHAANTFNFMPFLSKNWERRKIKEYMDEERNAYKNE